MLNNYTQVRLIIVYSTTELEDTKNTFVKENKPWVAVNKRFYIKSHHFYITLIYLNHFCLFKVGCFTAIKNASKFFLLQLFIGADIRSFHWKTWSGCWKRLTASELLFGSSCLFQRVITFRLVSPIWFPYKIRFTERLYMKDINFSPSKRKAVWLFLFPKSSKINFSFGKRIPFPSELFGYFLVFLTEWDVN